MLVLNLKKKNGILIQFNTKKKYNNFSSKYIQKLSRVLQLIQVHEKYYCLSPQGVQNILRIKIPAPNQK